MSLETRKGYYLLKCALCEDDFLNKRIIATCYNCKEKIKKKKIKPQTKLDKYI